MRLDAIHHEGHDMTESAADLRARLGHPVIDADGHWLEFGPVLADELERIGGAAAARGFKASGERVRRSLGMTPGQRREGNVAQEAFWGTPTRNTRDRATAMMPALLYDRLDEFGIDYAVLYPTAGLSMPRAEDAEARQAACRAFNIYQADMFARFADRMTPAAVIPMHTPDEAIAELDHAVGELGMKVVMLNSMIERPVTAPAPDAPAASTWFDMIGLDSAFDYDSVWQRCRDLGVSPTFHRGSRGRALRVSPTNFVYNHIGHFAAASEAVCKALFLGGVTRRFPDLNFAFLEGGVGWACLLYADLIGHWGIRHGDALADVDPGNLDLEMLNDLASTYAPEAMQAALAAGRGISKRNDAQTTGGIAELDDYANCGIESAKDIRQLFAEHFYFGCEADDSTNAWGFDTRGNPYGAELKTLFGSDIGHFDVQDMAHVLPEAYELVEEERLDLDQFKRFTFGNAVRFWGETNPAFFDGTAIAAPARELLGQAAKAESA